MTQKEIKLIRAINCDGITNNEWGVIDRVSNIHFIHGAEENKLVPPHIYIYRECEECHLRNEIAPNYTFRDPFDQVIDLYYLTLEDAE